jgi:hypothetical protein
VFAHAGRSEAWIFRLSRRGSPGNCVSIAVISCTSDICGKRPDQPVHRDGGAGDRAPAGVTTLVTLYNMLGLTHLAETAFKTGRFDLLGAHGATKLLLAIIVCVLRPESAELLKTRYHLRDVRHMPIGTPGIPMARPTLNRRQGILAFGHFGSNKCLSQ